MPFIDAPNGTCRCVLFFSIQGQECLVVNYVSVGPDDADASELQILADGVFAAWAANILTEQSNEVTLEKVLVTQVSEPNGLQVQSSQSPAIGGIAQPAANNALSVLVALNTGFSGRSFRGRMFIPGGRIDSIDSDSNYWESAYVADIQAGAVAYRTAVNNLTPVGAVPATWMVTSYYELDPTKPKGQRSVPRSVALNTAISSVSTRSRIATQRRRRPRS